MNGLLKGRRFFILLILMTIFSQIISSSNEEFNGKTGGSLPIPTQAPSNFIVYTVNGDDQSINYIFSVYADESKQTRIQLAQSLKGVAKLYLSLSDFPKKYIYWTIECSTYPCSGTVSYDYFSSFELKEGEPINYYVNQEREEISFSVNLSNGKYNIWARGEYEITSNIVGINPDKKEIGNSGVIY